MSGLVERTGDSPRSARGCGSAAGWGESVHRNDSPRSTRELEPELPVAVLGLPLARHEPSQVELARAARVSILTFASPRSTKLTAPDSGKRLESRSVASSTSDVPSASVSAGVPSDGGGT